MTENKPKAAAPQQTDASVIKELLASAPVQEEVAVDLPSKNKFYSLIDSSLPVTVRPMTFEDEKSLVSTKNANLDVLNVLLSRCVQNIDIRSLLIFDKLFLLMKLREVSYGHEYKAAIPCPQCRRDNKISFNLTELAVNYIEDTTTNPISVTLPVINKKVKVRFPRVADEQYLHNLESVTANLWRFIEEIDGHSKKTIISGVLKKLPLKDMHLLMDTIQGQKFGIDTKVRFACNYCSHHEVTDLPITADFFTVN